MPYVRQHIYFLLPHHQLKYDDFKSSNVTFTSILLLKSVWYIHTSSFSKRSGSLLASALAASMALSHLTGTIGCIHRQHSLRKDSPDVSQLQPLVITSVTFLDTVLCF